ncbi:uncharacterized protein SOCG_04973 [Schizosaccharomyces octosporus yFS286]|uniref:Uncharacterized protein n=1 Tax=Schizosaccharomyces octosporus (strain yFS286) TaxID=483514 RepID=S9Q048_SCHOY|nr:uncharacterized protein SOCG_04973 [Schizosaccharomyces octosporus yFS286]EPX73577.1 hypothetical protein SOCG_04973 [Schizosaccharomyces octosporus yFS286]
MYTGDGTACITISSFARKTGNYKIIACLFIYNGFPSHFNASYINANAPTIGLLFPLNEDTFIKLESIRRNLSCKFKRQKSILLNRCLESWNSRKIQPVKKG